MPRTIQLETEEINTPQDKRAREIHKQIRDLLDELETLSEDRDLVSMTEFKVSGFAEPSLFSVAELQEREDGLFFVPFELVCKPTTLVLMENREIEEIKDGQGQTTDLIPGPATTWFAFKAVELAG